MREPRYLFVLNPANAGSSAFAAFLLSSRKALALHRKAEGQWLPSVRADMEPGRWDPAKEMPWPRIKREWLAAWRERRAKRPEAEVLVEKSPPHLVRALELEQHFDNPQFIVLMRDPYAWCASLRHRKSSAFANATYAELAAEWVWRARFQRSNLSGLRTTLRLSYEEFVENPEAVKQKVMRFCPMLDDLDPTVEVKVKDYTPSTIKDHNPRQIALLSPEDRLAINDILAREESLVTFFGYALLEPA